MDGGANGRERYRETAVETAHPVRLIVMLYEGAIRFLNEAEEAIRRRDYDQQNHYIVKTQQILAELIGSLNLHEGGTIAENLLLLYTYMYNQLIEANLTDRLETILHVRNLLQELLEAWQQVARKVEVPVPLADSLKVSLHG